MHDNVRGISDIVPLNQDMCTTLWGVRQKMVQQDNISVIGGIGGSAIAFDNVFFSIFYENLVGASGSLISQADLLPRIVNLLTVNIVVTPSATGDWSAGVQINSVNDLFKANTKYAILSGLGAVASCMIGIQGPCTGNVISGIPFNTSPALSIGRVLSDLSIWEGLPTIPVMDSSDKAATFVYCADAGNSNTTFNLLLAELSS